MNFYLNRSHTSEPDDCEIGRMGVKMRTQRIHAAAVFRNFTIPHALREFLPEDADVLLEAGYAPRLYSHFFKKACADCEACLPVRIPLQRFIMNKDHRNILAANHLKLEFGDGLPPVREGGVTNSWRQLTETYNGTRFGSGNRAVTGMEPYAMGPSGDEFVEQHRKIPGMTPFYMTAAHENGDPAGFVIFHLGKKSVYATRLIYDLDLRKQQIGHYLALETIRELQSRGADYFYLAEWAQNSSFSWKDKLRPLELRFADEWIPVNTREDMRKFRDDRIPAYPAKRVFTP
jgi:arginine-tRNA-protein transferase